MLRTSEGQVGIDINCSQLELTCSCQSDMEIDSGTKSTIILVFMTTRIIVQLWSIDDACGRIEIIPVFEFRIGGMFTKYH
jgi:hypothetical protein